MDGHTRLTLLLARLLITDPGCWTAGVLARDPNGCPVSPLDDAARSWCARVAVYRIVGGDIQAYRRAVRALEEACQALYGASISGVNDGPPMFAHAAVLAAFDHAVDALGLARRAYDLTTRQPDNGADVLQILGLRTRLARKTICVHLTDVDPLGDDAQTLMEEQHVATISARA